MSVKKIGGGEAAVEPCGRGLARHRIFGAAGIRAELEPSEGPCLRCGGPTEVQKSVEHRVVTLEHGDFIAHETILVCKARCRQPSGELVTGRSEALLLRVSPGKVYGYDLEVHVRIERFLHHRQREEIRSELAQRHGIGLSSGQVSALAVRFLEHLDALHASRAPKLRAAMDRDGGYPLYIDATGGDGRGTMLVGFSGWRRWVLGAWKLPTERAEFILPALRCIGAKPGLPRLGRSSVRLAWESSSRLCKARCGESPQALGREANRGRS